MGGRDGGRDGGTCVVTVRVLLLRRVPGRGLGWSIRVARPARRERENERERTQRRPPVRSPSLHPLSFSVGECPSSLSHLERILAILTSAPVPCPPAHRFSVRLPGRPRSPVSLSHGISHYCPRRPPRPPTLSYVLSFPPPSFLTLSHKNGPFTCLLDYTKWRSTLS